MLVYGFYIYFCIYFSFSSIYCVIAPGRHLWAFVRRQRRVLEIDFIMMAVGCFYDNCAYGCV